ncbi:IQ motif and SEC7 domain-containing protein 2 [Nibea albiflora]|uniref:IQ motif and SEC7 domain-containing protein 2 n=1 Tax=Nibea albiflora TaxID=240163 RepID=A0ACB7EYP4_NIBAL|nr:IQ motif and SEC7 domain-containing protein 2 [Nibea albiflora]
MDGQRGFYEMENPTENPSKAAEYLKELNKIIETQQGLLEKQRVRIDELELQVTDLCKENACLKDQHQRHLATCRLQQGNLSTLGAIKENVMQEKNELRALDQLSVAFDGQWQRKRKQDLRDGGDCQRDLMRVFSALLLTEEDGDGGR